MNAVGIARVLLVLRWMGVLVRVLAGAIFAEANLWVACEILRSKHLIQSALVVCIFLFQTRCACDSLRLFLRNLRWQLGESSPRSP